MSTAEAIDNTLLELPPIGVRGTALLAGVAGIQRTSAVMLRYHGREADARRAEQAAMRITLAIEDRRATARMFESARAVRKAVDHEHALGSAVEGAMSLLGADFGNIQLRDPEGGALRIAYSGFDQEFLEHFATVADDAAACGRAASQHAEVVIVDVDKDEAFEPHRHVAAASRFRSVHSTPLVDGAVGSSAFSRRTSGVRTGRPPSICC